MGEIPANTFRRYRDKGASLVYMRMESTDRLLYKDIFIRERGYEERIKYALSLLFSIAISKNSKRRNLRFASRGSLYIRSTPVPW